MDILNESSFTIDELTNETRKASKLTTKKFLGILIFMGVSLLLSILSLILNIVNNKSYVVSMYLAILIFAVFLFTLLIMLRYPKMMKKNYIKTFGEKGMTYVYKFFINRVEVVMNVRGKGNSGKLHYTNLYKIVENKTLIILYVDKHNFFLVKKNAFKDNDLEKVQKAIINSKAKYKYINK